MQRIIEELRKAAMERSAGWTGYATASVQGCSGGIERQGLQWLVYLVTPETSVRASAETAKGALDGALAKLARKQAGVAV